MGQVYFMQHTPYRASEMFLLSFRKRSAVPFRYRDCRQNVLSVLYERELALSFNSVESIKNLIQTCLSICM